LPTEEFFGLANIGHPVLIVPFAPRHPAPVKLSGGAGDLNCDVDEIFNTLVMLQVGYRTYANSRYFIFFLIPGLIIVFYLALRVLLKNNKLCIAAIYVLILLSVVQSFRSIDPAGFWVYGKFAFGKHQLYKMTGLTHECCGFGRDQLVYNLEYTKLRYLIDKIFSTIKPQNDEIVVYTGGANWYLFDTVFNQRAGEDLLPDQNKPAVIYFLVFPNFSNGQLLLDLSRFYQKEESIVYDIDGYRIEVIKMRLKNNPL